MSARRGAGAGAGERGLILPVVLAVLLLATLLLGALFTYLNAQVAAGGVYQDRVDRVQASSDVVHFAFNALRNDNTLGRAGTTTSWTYDGVTATCVGDAGSGVLQGAGRTDRTVTCTSPSVRATVRFFDRSGAANGVIAEQLSWTVLA